MSTGLFAVLVAFFAASLRALDLWRVNVRVDVINVVVVTTFGEGREDDVSRVLAASGRAPYLEVAGSMCEAARDLLARPSRVDGLRAWLEAHALRALVPANRRLRRGAWLDSVTLVAVLFAGVTSVTTGATTGKLALMLFAVTLLWLANVLAVRSVSTRMVAGAMALAESLAQIVAERPPADVARPED